MPSRLASGAWMSRVSCPARAVPPAAGASRAHPRQLARQHDRHHPQVAPGPATGGACLPGAPAAVVAMQRQTRLAARWPSSSACRRSGTTTRRRRRWPARRPGHPAGRGHHVRIGVPARRGSTGVGQHVRDRAGAACARPPQRDERFGQRPGKPAAERGSRIDKRRRPGTWRHGSEARPAARSRAAQALHPRRHTLGRDAALRPSSCANTCTRSSSRSQRSACASRSSDRRRQRIDERRQLQHPRAVADRVALRTFAAQPPAPSGSAGGDQCLAGLRTASRAAPAPPDARMSSRLPRPSPSKGSIRAGPRLRPDPGIVSACAGAASPRRTAPPPMASRHRAKASGIAHRSRPSAVQRLNAPSTRSARRRSASFSRRSADPCRPMAVAHYSNRDLRLPTRQLLARLLPGLSASACSPAAGARPADAGVNPPRAARAGSATVPPSSCNARDTPARRRARHRHRTGAREVGQARRRHVLRRVAARTPAPPVRRNARAGPRGRDSASTALPSSSRRLARRCGSRPAASKSVADTSTPDSRFRNFASAPSMPLASGCAKHLAKRGRNPAPARSCAATPSAATWIKRGRLVLHEAGASHDRRGVQRIEQVQRHCDGHAVVDRAARSGTAPPTAHRPARYKPGSARHRPDGRPPAGRRATIPAPPFRHDRRVPGVQGLRVCACGGRRSGYQRACQSSSTTSPTRLAASPAAPVPACAGCAAGRRWVLISPVSKRLAHEDRTALLGNSAVVDRPLRRQHQPEQADLLAAEHPPCARDQCGSWWRRASAAVRRSPNPARSGIGDRPHLLGVQQRRRAAPMAAASTPTSNQEQLELAPARIRRQRPLVAAMAELGRQAGDQRAVQPPRRTARVSSLAQRGSGSGSLSLRKVNLTPATAPRRLQLPVQDHSRRRRSPELLVRHLRNCDWVRSSCASR